MFFCSNIFCLEFRAFLAISSDGGGLQESAEPSPQRRREEQVLTFHNSKLQICRKISELYNSWKEQYKRLLSADYTVRTFERRLANFKSRWWLPPKMDNNCRWGSNFADWTISDLVDARLGQEGQFVIFLHGRIPDHQKMYSPRTIICQLYSVERDSFRSLQPPTTGPGH